MNKVKFGIIGFGFMGHVHEEMLTKDIDEAEVLAICDVEPDRMDDAITEGVKKFTDYEELLKLEEIDTVLVVIPNQLHKDCVIKAAEYKKNIICEKPAAMNSEELEEMLAAVEKHGVRFTVHQQRRFDQDFRIMKEVYDKEMIGNLYTVQTKLYGINGNMHDWHVFKKFGGGMLYDWGVHLIDQMLYMIDSKIVSVYADIRNVINGEVDDYFKILIRFENGIMGEVELGTYFLKDEKKWFERHWFMGGDEGTAYVDGFDPQGKVARTAHLLKSVAKKTTMTKSGPTRSFGPPQPGLLLTEELPHVSVAHRMFFDDYIHALETGEDFLVQPDQVKRVFKVMEAVRKSGETNQVIKFDD